jgi:DNA-binding response OmpR family regulator
MQALKAGAVDVLAKPFDDRVLLRRVRAALEP